jgi:hypothetical protein
VEHRFLCRTLPHYFFSGFNASELLGTCERGKGAAKAMHEDDGNDDHPGIPRDAEGVPIFLILPPGLLASYDRNMAYCEDGWRATQDPAFVSAAQRWTSIYRQPPAAWLTDAVVSLLAGLRTKGHAARAHSRDVQLTRWDMVQRAHREEGLSWDAAYIHAAKMLTGTAAAGTPGTMKDAYVKVGRTLKAGRNDEYILPQMPNPPS